MPRNIYTQIQLPPEQPDRCSKCPLLGKRPQSELTKGERKAYCCLGVFTPNGFAPLTSKGIENSAQAYKRSQRKLHRPCDSRWDVWLSLPGRRLPITNEAWKERRYPYELELQQKYYKSLFK